MKAPPTLSPATAMMQSPASANIPEEPQGAEPPLRQIQYPSGTSLFCASTASTEAPPSKPGPNIWPGESSRSRPEPSRSPAAQSPAQSSPQLSPASRIRRPLFHYDPTPGNVDYHAKDFHGESYYDILALAADPTVPRIYAIGPQVFTAAVYDSKAIFLILGVVLEFYHTMTSRGVSMSRPESRSDPDLRIRTEFGVRDSGLGLFT